MPYVLFADVCRAKVSDLSLQRAKFRVEDLGREETFVRLLAFDIPTLSDWRTGRLNPGVISLGENAVDKTLVVEPNPTALMETLDRDFIGVVMTITGTVVGQHLFLNMRSR